MAPRHFLLKLLLCKGEASDGMMAFGGKGKALKMPNHFKLFIGELKLGMSEETLSGIMKAKDCAPSSIHLVLGLSLFRMMSCLFFYFCFLDCHDIYS